jgi:hypothetical protein
MNKIVLFSMIALAGVTVSAANVNKEEFLARKKAQAEKAGTEFNAKQAASAFTMRDLNKDGVLSPAELTAPQPAPKPVAKPAE